MKDTCRSGVQIPHGPPFIYKKRCYIIMKTLIGLLSPVLFIVGVLLILLNPLSIEIITMGMIVITISLLSLAYYMILGDKKKVVIKRKRKSLN